jgi:hypothetical protein
MTTTDSDRLRTLALSSLACAFLTSFVALSVQHLSLDPSDEAARQPFLATLLDPFVLTLWLPCLVLGAGVGFLASVVMLRTVRLERAIPLVTLACVAAAAVVAPFVIVLSPLFGLAFAWLAMDWCRHHRAWQLPGPPESSTPDRPGAP